MSGVDLYRVRSTNVKELAAMLAAMFSLRDHCSYVSNVADTMAFARGSASRYHSWLRDVGSGSEQQRKK